MKPCNCKSIEEAKQLNEQGIRFNNNSLTVIPNNVILKLENTIEIKINMKLFKRFAEWYLKEQK